MQKGFTTVEFIILITIIAVFVAIAIISATVHNNNKKIIERESTIYGKILTEDMNIDGCEYILFHSTLTHKGNCTNCWSRMEKIHSNVSLER